MKRLAPLLAFTAVLAACGSTADVSSDAGAAAGPVFLAHTAGAAGPLTGYDAAGLGRRFELPGGIQAADGRSYYALDGGKLVRFDPFTGTVDRRYPLRGSWKLAGVSSNGDWVALQRPGTRIRILDTRTGRIAHDLELHGDFTVETVSAPGDFLFLQQRFVDGSYAVRGYDLASGQMLPGSLGTKGQLVQMQGLASQVVASPDGRWLLTLYVNTQTDTAFVHALNLIERFAVCINLPPCTNCSRERLQDWVLALSPDGRTLFAANPALGRVATIYLPVQRLIAESRFTPEVGGVTRTAISPDGSQLAFTNGTSLWSFDTNVGWARELPAGARAIADLGFRVDGTLLLARKGAPLLALDE
jgi:hypothetical protein